MVLEVRLFLERSEDEFLLAKTDYMLSCDIMTKKNMGIPEYKTFYHSVISHAYFSIFYAAKAYLFNKKIKTHPPGEHQRTLKAFKNLVKEGIVDKELLNIYERELSKASTLLEIFQKEKEKRGYFTYNIQSEANIPFAQESLENARIFIASIKRLL